MINLGTKKLLIISHVRHYYYNGDLYAYAPYVKEMDRIGNIFSNILIASPCLYSMPSSDLIQFNNRNISMVPIIETGGNTFVAKLKQIILTPLILLKLIRYMILADSIHVRCPGNLGLLGALFAPFFSKYIYAKYSGIWGPFPGEALTVKLQRYILKSPLWKKGIVTVYAEKPEINSHNHIVPFFTSVMSQDEMESAKLIALKKSLNHPVNLIYVGRLSPDKNVDIILQAAKLLIRHHEDVFLDILGDGPESGELKDFVIRNNLSDHIKFHGHLKSEKLRDFYEKSHILLLVSESEGWPKAITEAMAYGLVCIGANRGLIPSILSGDRGFVVPPRSPEALVQKLEEILNNPDYFKLMSKNASAWSQNYTLDLLEEELQKLLLSRWGKNPNETTTKSVAFN